jgi:hypothetical protein
MLSAMDELDVMNVLRCEECLECNRPWLDGTERWRAYVDSEGDVLLYCPRCASREFGD